MKNKSSYFGRQFKLARQEWSRNNTYRKMCFFEARRKDESGMEKWICKSCSKLFAKSEVDCDHVLPISNTTPDTIEEYIECFKKLHSTDLQILCKNCHKFKTKEEAHQRARETLIVGIDILSDKLGYVINTNSLNLILLKKLSKILENLVKTNSHISQIKLNKFMERYC